MGTKNCAETPRQKMINMMYLVLTAMLALNVAVETLQAFRLVNSSLMKTYNSFNEKNESIINDFQNAYSTDSVAVKKWKEAAGTIKLKTDSLLDYIVETKEILVSKAGGEKKINGEEIAEDEAAILNRKGDTLILKRQDDLNVSPEIMINKKRGDSLKNKIVQYKEELIGIIEATEDSARVDATIIPNIEHSLDVSDPVNSDNQSLNYKTWAQMNFEASPVIASVTLLSKLQIDVCNAESAVLSYLYNQIHVNFFHVTGLRATVIPDASYIFQGQQYRARIFLSAEDSTQALQVYINGSQNSPLNIEDNEAIYSFIPQTPGNFSYSGEIKYRNYSFPFTQEYEVARPAVTISPTKMNVLYKGLKDGNPISISVPGVSSNAVTATMTNGTITFNGQSWIAKPNNLDVKGTNTSIDVMAQIDGKQINMGTMAFRVKSVPDPVFVVPGADKTGRIFKVVLSNTATTSRVGAQLKDFDFDLRFKVVSFDISVPTGGNFWTTEHSSSDFFTKNQQALINSLSRGDKITFENIRAKNVDDPADVRLLSSLTLTIR